jgi:putative transposase
LIEEINKRSMEKKDAIQQGHYYHIYNRGNNRMDIFFENENYSYFLKLYQKYIDPIAETFAWCLMKNHFHLLVRIKRIEEVDGSQLHYSTIEKPKLIDPSRQFSHLFNAYTQAINKKYNRTGKIFESTFERKRVSTEKYFQQLIFYIHNNPVHHGFVNKINEYAWSSYETVISEKKTKLKREDVITTYGGLENFILYHNQNHNLKEIEAYIIE